MKKAELKDFNVFRREEKYVEIIQEEIKTQKLFLFFFVWRVSEVFYSPGTDYEAVTLVGLGPPPSNGLGWG